MLLIWQTHTVVKPPGTVVVDEAVSHPQACKLRRRFIMLLVRAVNMAEPCSSAAVVKHAEHEAVIARLVSTDAANECCRNGRLAAVQHL